MKKLLYYFLIGFLSLSSSSLLAQKADHSEDKPANIVEQMPQFPGGESALLNFIKENLKYPKASSAAGIEGRVIIRFVVNREGSVTNVTVIRGLDSLCNDEAVRVVKMMPKWKPGMQQNSPVSVYYTLPIAYKLQKDGNGTTDPLLLVDGISKPYALLKDTILLKPSTIKSITILKDSSAIASGFDGPRSKNGVIIVETIAHAAKIDSAIKYDKPIYGVEVMPQFPGGEQALMTFIKQNLHYPRADAERSIQGRTTIRFIITKTGQVSYVTVVKGLSPGCDAEAIRVVQMMPTWKPGLQKGVPVNVYYTLPFVFKLQR